MPEPNAEDDDIAAKVDQWQSEIRPLHFGSEYHETGGVGTDPSTLNALQQVLLTTASVLDERAFVTEEALRVASFGPTGSIGYVEDRLNREGAVLMQNIWYLKNRLQQNAVTLKGLQKKRSLSRLKRLSTTSSSPICARARANSRRHAMRWVTWNAS
jgi:hypothetical protein